MLLKDLLDVVDEYTILHVIDKDHHLLAIRDNLKHGFDVDPKFYGATVINICIDVFGYLDIMISI